MINGFEIEDDEPTLVHKTAALRTHDHLRRYVAQQDRALLAREAARPLNPRDFRESRIEHEARA